MIDAVKDYFDSKRFGVVAYVSLIVQFNCGLILIPVFVSLRASEIGKFSCAVDTQSTAAYKTYAEKTCYSRYEHTYNSPLPLYGFVLLSFGLTVLVSLIYSLAVSRHVDEIAESISNGSEGSRSDSEQTSRGFYVFWFYVFHLVARSVFGIVFTILQYTVFYPSGFDFKFSCSVNATTTMCENSTARENVFWGVVVSVLNTVFALVIFVEVFRLCRRFRSKDGWSCDTEFITDYLLCKRYTPNKVELTSVVSTSSHLSSPPVDWNAPDNNTADSSLQDCTEFYKQQVLHPSRTYDICYAQETDLDDVYIEVLIHTGRAPHKFSKEMDRHEIYNVYMEVPETSIRLQKVQDLFYPNNDTKGKSPRTILAVGRPGIGKTVLTEKVMRDWANGIDEFYAGKIAFYVKFRWFSSEEMKNVSLKTFLRYGTGLSDEKFESIFKEISNKPEKAILIFDGLDEFGGDLGKCFDQTRMLSNDHNTPMSPMTLFIKMAFGNMLHRATILVTSRPTADEFYSKLHFDRSVEIIGFTSEKIEEYVSRFCDNKNVRNLKPMIWNHIESSSNLLNLCYIPVNCFIVCVTLSGCLINSNNDTGALPTTTTALYQTAVGHFGKCHNRNLDKMSSEQMLEKLQKLAFDGMENGQLIFNEKYFDAQMRKCGLVNSLTNPIRPLETQFCFIHLTIQEFLAAKHVIETLPPDEIEKFISTQIESGQWQLVLQFIAGLLGEKIKMSGSEYQDCVLAFAKSLTLSDGEINLDDYCHMFVMKCLREVDDKGIVKNVCETSDLSNARSLGSSAVDYISSSDWAAVTFVCKHLNNLIHLRLILTDTFVHEVCDLLQQKCFESLDLAGPVSDMESLLGAMIHSKCTLNHEHAKLRQLIIVIDFKDAEVSNLCTFIKDGHASNLRVLHLQGYAITSGGIFELCEVFNDELCGELTHLNFGGNNIGDNGAGMLCNAIKGHCKINTLVLDHCSLTAECVHGLSSVLCDEHCKLTELSLRENRIGDEGVRMLCTKALGKEQCKLMKLNLGQCSLTTECVRLLSEVLCDEHCKLTDLSLVINPIGDEGVRILCREALGKEQCKLTKLDLSNCSLTTECVCWLCEVLCEEHCKLTDLSLCENAIGDEGVRTLCTDVLRTGQCKLTNLFLNGCSLTDKCVPLLCETLQDRNCRLIQLSVTRNNFTKQGRSLLLERQEVEIGIARFLDI